MLPMWSKVGRAIGERREKVLVPGGHDWVKLRDETLW